LQITDRDSRTATHSLLNSRDQQHETRNTKHATFLLLLALLVALFLRVYRLDEIPAGLDYDESAYLILSQEIASGQSHPIFVRAYAGREAIFFWLAAASIRLLGRTVFAFRLTSALCGVTTLLVAYLLAREMFDKESRWERRWLPLLTATLIAISYWQVHVNRYGYRANSMPVFLTATMVFLWRGLRRNRWLDLAIGGLFCGLSANTYLAIRAFPLVLGPFVIWAILAWQPEGTVHGNWRWLRVRQVTLFGLVALVAFAPLGVFFLRNPEFFNTRMGQVSILDPEINGGDLWGALGRVTVQALGVFTVRGDSNPVYNYDQRPIFGLVLGLFFYLGLLVCLWRALFRRGDHQARTPYLLILIWLPIMLIPNILGARGVPHSLRSLGIVPAVFYLPALGLVAVIQTAQRAYARLRVPKPTAAIDGDRRPGRIRSLLARVRADERDSPVASRALTWVGAVLVMAILALGGAQTYQWYFRWAQDPAVYYGIAVDVRHAAEYLSQWDPNQFTLFVSNDTYRHTTMAAFCTNYAYLKWFSGATLVFPAPGERPALYSFDHTNPLDPVLSRYLPAGTLQHRELGPDGKVGFEAYLVPPGQMPRPQPQVPVQANLGNALTFLGYDLNAPAVSGGLLDVTHYWRIARDGAQDDWTFFAHLVDDQGFRWGGETFFSYPSEQWKAGEVVLFRQRIPIAAGAPPGAYTLDLGVFSPSLDMRLSVLNEAGQPSGTTAHVGPLVVGRAAAPPAELPPIQQPHQATFGQALHLLGFDRDRGDLRPGETLALSLYWQADAELPRPSTVSLWLEGQGARTPLWNGHPAHGSYPFDRWQPPEFIRDRYALRLPTDTPASDMDLRLAVLAADGKPLSTSDGAASVSLGTLHVHATDRRWEPPVFAYPVGVKLADKVELLGYDLDRQQARPGETVHLTLAWRCLQAMDSGYTVFTHLLDAGEQVRGQRDNPPVRGTYPTTLWVPGEVVVDEYDIMVQPGALPGTHVIEVGMYDPANLQRLPVMDPTGTVGDRILLGQVRIVP